MSVGNLSPVRCPACGQEFAASLLDAINVLQHPELREQLLAGQVNVIDCPSCAQRFHVPRPVLYHDARRRILVWSWPETDPEKQKRILEEHRKLITEQFALLPAPLRPRKVRYIFGGLDELLAVVLALESNGAPDDPAQPGGQSVTP